jgi:hypothetical protein
LIAPICLFDLADRAASSVIHWLRCCLLNRIAAAGQHDVFM